MANCSCVRRAIAALVLLVTALAPAMPAAAACTGWAASPVQRMACCHAAEGHCAAFSADDCCADSESRQHAELAATVVVSAGAMTAGYAVPQPRHLPSPLVPPASSARPDTYLLDSVFRI